MPRDGSGIYSKLQGTTAVADTTIDSAKYNNNVDDVVNDLNLPRPIVAGGTNATSADGALDNLAAEKFKQVVTNWDSTTWRAGSFYAATSAIGAAPVAGHAFAGLAYYANATDFICEATDLTDPNNPVRYVRTQTAGVWNAWSTAAGGGVSPGSTLVGDYSFDTTVTFPPSSGQVRFNNATQNSTTELFFSHLTATGIDVTTALPLSILNGSEITIRDKVTPAKYKIFTATAAPVLSGGDFRVTAVFKSGGTDLTALRVQISTTGLAVRYDITQTLTAVQKAQARANIDSLKKNYILNGAMQISQENGATAGTASGYYAADQWSLVNLSGGTLSVAQVASPTPAGSPNRLRGTVTVADAAVAAGDFVCLRQAIEGYRVADLRSGSAAAKIITVQFGVKAPAGTYCVGLENAATNRNYNAEYVIAAGEANTDVIKSVTIQLDATGTWATDNTVGLYVAWSLMCGLTYQTPAGAWAAGNLFASPNQFNFMGTNGNVFELFDVGLYEGAVAPTFQVPDYVSELVLCKRYYCRPEFGFQGYSSGNIFYGGTYAFQPPMRAAPTVSFNSTILVPVNSSGSYSFGGVRSDSVLIYLAAAVAGGFSYDSLFNANARL